MGENSTRKASTVMVNRKSQTSKYFDFDDNGVLKAGQNKYGKFEPGFNEKIYNARWLSDESFDFGEGSYRQGWTVWDQGEGAVYSDEIENLPIEQAITNDAAHEREFIYVKDADLWIVLDKMTNTHNEANEYSCMWHFPAEGQNDWQLTGFKNEEVVIDEEENLVKTADKDGPNLFIYNFSQQPLTFEKYYGFWEKGNREAYGWSLGNGNASPPELGCKFVPRPEVHVRWTDEKKGDVTRLASVLAPSENTEAPIVSKKNISDGDITGFELETVNGARVSFYSSDTVQRYSIGNIAVNAKEAVFVEKDGATKILALDSNYVEQNNVSLNYMLNSNCSIGFDKNMKVTGVVNFGIPETFAWLGDKKTAGAHKPVYTLQDAERDYTPAGYAQDVQKHWGRYYILKLEELGVVERQEQFCPDDAVTRGEFAAWLVRANGEDLTEYANCFSDISHDDPCAEYVQTAYNLGWLEGDNGKFYPDSSLTREEMSCIVARILQTKDGTKTTRTKEFSDAESIADWARGAVALCLSNGVVSGDESFNFHPKDSFSRAKAAKVTARIFCDAY